MTISVRRQIVEGFLRDLGGKEPLLTNFLRQPPPGNLDPGEYALEMAAIFYDIGCAIQRDSASFDHRSESLAQNVLTSAHSALRVRADFEAATTRKKEEIMEALRENEDELKADFKTLAGRNCWHGFSDWLYEEARKCGMSTGSESDVPSDEAENGGDTNPGPSGETRERPIPKSVTSARSASARPRAVKSRPGPQRKAKTKPMTRGHAGPSRPNVDIGIITIKEEEFEAVLDEFDPDPDRVWHGETRDYEIAEMPISQSPSDTCSVAITRCLKQGNTYSQAAATQLLNDLSPRFVLLVGIAGGVPSEDFCLGDVVVADDIRILTVEEVASGGQRRFDAQGMPLHPSASRIVERIRMIERASPDWAEPNSVGNERPQVRGAFTTDDQDWNDSITKAFATLEKRDRPISRARPVASSDRLVKAPDLVRAWKDILRGIAAVEMESAGVHIHCHSNRVPVLTIRGLSDVVGWKRDEDWTRYACHTAAAFARMLVASGVFVSRVSD